MILLQQVKLTNFLSHYSTTIDFEKNCKKIIIGPSGSGKSSIPDAITFALYGVGRVPNRSLIKKGKKAAKVQLTLIDGDITYCIDRSVDSAGKNSLEIHTKEGDKAWKPLQVIGLREKEIYLEKQILHSSYILFINSILYPQNNVENFVNQTAAKRKEILLEIINADSFDNYLKLTKEKLNGFEQTKSNNDSIINTINLSLSEDKLLAVELPAIQAEEQTKKKEIEQVNELLKGLSAKLTELNFKEKTKAEKEKELINFNNFILPAIKTEIQSLTIKIKELEELDTVKLQAEVANLDDLKAKFQAFRAMEQSVNEWNTKTLEIMRTKPLARNFDNEIAEINKQLIALLSQPTEKCPKCGFVLPNLYKDSNIKRLQEELITRNQEKAEYVKKEEVYFKAIEGLGAQPLVDRTAISTLETEISVKEKRKAEIEIIIKNREWDIKIHQGKLEDKIKELNENENKIIKLAEEIEVLKNEIKDSDAIKKEEENLTSKKIILENAYNILIGKLSVANEALRRVTANEEKVKILVKENNKLGENVELLELLRGAFSPNGIKAIITDYIIPELEERINIILSKLSSFRIKLSTQKSSVDGEKVIEGLWLTIINDQNEELDFLNYSGGEKMRISLAIQEGLATLQKIGFRIMDEVIVGLDQNTIEDFGSVMIKLKEDISQILVISHISEIKDLFEDKLEIKKINGTSEIVLYN